MPKGKPVQPGEVGPPIGRNGVVDGELDDKTQPPNTLSGVYGGDTTTSGRMGVSGDSTNGIGVMGTSANNIGVYGLSDQNEGVRGESKSKHAGVTGFNTGGGPGIYGSGGGAPFSQTPFSGAAQFDGDVQVNGDHHVSKTLFAITDVVLGADCAEEFDIAKAAEAEPGTVMVLDDHGTLQPSAGAYDKKVAGVVSGAGDYKPGIILNKCPSSHGRTLIALLGKVYCKADAEYSPIRVGDLLTTSPTPGHAMKAADPARAFGAVLGKAMSPLMGGRDLIPILIALQ